jgi:dihydrofolate reductase
MAENRVIGREGGLPWQLPDDLKFFKQATLGKPLIMGRRTHESIGRPLPGRPNIVVTTNPSYRAPGCTIVGSVADGLQAAGLVEEIMVIGGETLYRQTLAWSDRIYLTLVHAQVDGTARFPSLDWQCWREACRQHHPADERHAYSFSFIRLDRREPHTI